MIEQIRRHRNIVLKIAVIILGVAAVGAILYFARLNTRFYPGTVIEGVDCSELTAAEAADKLRGAVLQRPVLICDEAGGELLRFTLADFCLDTGELADRIDSMMAEQHSKGPVGLISGCREFRLRWLTADEILPMVRSAGDHGYIDPVDAVLLASDGGWRITMSQAGSQPDHMACAETLARMLETEPLGESGGAVSAVLYLLPVQPRTAESDALLNTQLDQINAVMQLSILLDFGQGLTYELSGEELLSLYDVSLTEEGASVKYVPERLPGFLDKLIEELGADGVERKFGPTDREEYYCSDWDRGFTLDRQKLYRQTSVLLSIRRSGTVTAEYDYTSALTGYYADEEISDTYIEISIQNQYMWYYKDGQLLVATPVVTGCVKTGDDTRVGVFSVAYMEEDTYLSGGDTNTGPGYDVDYWMPFDGNIGLHDAQWVEEFGGDIYLENGSHGCVNTPLEAMKMIFENCRQYCTVVVY